MACRMQEKKLLELQRQAVTDGLNYLYQERLLCDTILEAENEQVKVHKCILAALSPYFRAMFSFDDGKLGSTVTLHDLPGSTLCDIVKYMYTGHIDINDNNVQALTSAANMLQIDSLLNFCGEYMGNALCIENCLEVFMFADHLCLASLKDSVSRFVLDHFTDVFRNDQFCLLDCNTLSQLLKSDDLNVFSEDIVFEAVMLWIKHDIETRKNDLPLLLLCVRLPLMCEDSVKNIVSQEGLILENALCKHLVSQYLSCHAEGKSRESTSFCCTPRLGMFEKEMLVFSGGAFSFDDRAFSCIELDTFESYYSIEPHSSFDLKFKLDLFRLVVTPKNQIICMGGIFYNDYHFQRDSADASNAVLKYDQKNREWIPLPSMPTGRCGFAVCCYNQSVYVFGGYEAYPGEPPTDQTLCYDTDLEIWSQRQRMPLKLALQAVASVGDAAFLFGGKDESHECLPLVLHYQLNTDQWSMVETNIPVPTAEASAFAHKDKIYLLGGSNRNGYIVSVMIFEVDKQHWSFGADFPEHRKLLSIAGLGNNIFVFGGVKHLQLRPGALRGGRTVECKDLYRYCIEQNVWTKESRSVKYGNCFACCIARVNVKLLAGYKDVNLLCSYRLEP